jgi:hypothetical protein
MQPHLSNLQFFAGIVVLALAGILVLAAILDIRKRRKSAPFLNYFYSNFEQDQSNRESLDQSSFSGRDEWRAYPRERMHAFQGRHTTVHNSSWE